MFQSIKDFEPRNVLTIKYILKSKQTRIILLNIPIILLSNKIQVYKRTIRKLFFKKFTQDNRILISVFYVLSQRIWGMCTPL